MKIGILGTGHIGQSLVKKLSAAGRDVKVANSRGPETIDAELLSSGARAVTIDEALSDHSPGWRAMGQVSLGEILASPDEAAFFAVNSKRVDLLIVDADCRPLHAVEFQGKGHHNSRNTAARDAVKREALRRAGIGYVEVVSGDTPAEVREMVRKLAERVASG